MSGKKNIGVGVTKSVYIKSDGIHAFSASGQTYTAIAGESLIEQISTMKAVNFKKNDRGEITYEHIIDSVVLRLSPDNGLNWNKESKSYCFDPENVEEQIFPTAHSLDEKNDILIRFHVGKKADKTCYGYINQGTYRIFYSLSKDHGMTWNKPVQIVDKHPGYDPVCWGPGFKYEVRGGIVHKCVWMEDGSVVIPCTVYERLDGSKPWFFLVVCARGYWNKEKSGLDWVFGENIVVPCEMAQVGCCEPTLAGLGGNKLFIVTRCQGDQNKGLYSTRYTAYSADGGMTWSSPEPLKYDDGTTVWTPASLAEFFKTSRTGKTYLLANFLEKPVFFQEPRYPLTIAEFDPHKICIIKKTVRIIQDKPDDAPLQRRYTNFGFYEDRKSGSLVITLPEEPRNKNWDEFEREEDAAADCVKYVVELS